MVFFLEWFKNNQLFVAL